MAVSGPLVSIQRLTKRYGSVTAVWRADLDIEEGDFWVIFGPNGAGKTTLLRMVAQLAQPSEGSIHFREEEGGRGRVGYVSHQSLLYNELSGFENLFFFARLYGMGDPEDRARDQLKRMDLEWAGDLAARGYSSGMRQRLTLARALIHEPQLLLLDEPYAGLDQHGSRLLTEVLEKLKAEGRTVLLITHNLAQGLAVSNRLAVMSRGRIVYRGGREEVSETNFESLYFELVKGGMGDGRLT
jgi:heme exporter protein A